MPALKPVAPKQNPQSKISIENPSANFAVVNFAAVNSHSKRPPIVKSSIYFYNYLILRQLPREPRPCVSDEPLRLSPD